MKTRFFFLTLINTCFFIGKIPFMPGTLGSIFGCFLSYIIYSCIASDKYILIWGIINIFLIVLGIYVSNLYIKEIVKDNKDPQEVVIDEVVGQSLAYWITFPTLLSCSSKIIFILPFLLFRFFDILKPWPICSLEKLGGGLGIMMDDVIAGIFAGLICIFFVNF